MEHIIYCNSNKVILTDCKNTNISSPTTKCLKKSDIPSLLSRIQTEKSQTYRVCDNNISELLEYIKSFFVYIEAAGGVVQNNNTEILCIERHGLWDLPKGKLEKRESPEEAAVREVMEETGLTTVQRHDYLCSTWHTYEHPKGKGSVLKQTYWYMMSTDEHELIPQAEEHITEAIWISCNDLARITEQTYDSIRDVLNAYVKKISIFDI
ncbi:MAG: NUDIX hydrolase [Bacteroidales bacterium]|jgi:8-oxo-dGTP pyrophosphatase MutT (NUDIX family)|nr:NUDIX hydrolase [Bacteroidales bacterium]